MEEALADPAFDAVIIANRSDLHAQTALRYLANGKPTLAEIPVAMSYIEAEGVGLAAKHKESRSER